MEVTHKILGEVIAACYTAIPVVTDEFVGFGVEADGFVIEVVVFLFAVEPKTEPERQAVQILMWFCHENKQRFNLKHMPFGDLLKLCHVLQDDLEWGTLSLHKADEETVEIGLFRSMEISAPDLALACNKDSNSEFVRILERMCIECVDLNDQFGVIAEKQIHNLAEMDLLLCEPFGRA